MWLVVGTAATDKHYLELDERTPQVTIEASIFWMTNALPFAPYFIIFFHWYQCSQLYFSRAEQSRAEQSRAEQRH